MATEWLPVIGAAIQRQRTKAGLKWASLSELTRNVGRPVHRVALGKIERGERDITIMELTGIAAALGVPPASLLFPNVLDDIEVLPDRPIRGLAALGWFIGAGHPVGLVLDESYVPPGVETSDAMRIPLELLQLEAALAQQRHSLLQSERGPQVLTMPAALRERAEDDARRAREAIAVLEGERERLISAYMEKIRSA